MKRIYSTLAIVISGLSAMAQLNPNTAPKSPVDRFSATAGHLMVRNGTNGLPAANASVNFDQGPFITLGKGPNGEFVEYYNFDVQPTTPAPIYVLIRTGETAPVAGQLNIVNVKPGDSGYNDFWQVNMVTVPANYVANTVTSYQAITTAGYSVQPTTTLVNCPIVPDGSTAVKRLDNASNTLTKGWYKDSVVTYFNFTEKALMGNMVPTSPIFVTFNINPGQPGGGPPSGFVVETGTMQTHNVISTLPADAGYSPLWDVSMYDNTAFSSVMNLATASSASVLVASAADVNCPVVSIALNPMTAPQTSVDRFSAAAGHLMVRNGTNGLPAANAPVNFDQDPFITKGKGPGGEFVEYYNFDVQPTVPAPIYALIRIGETAPVSGQSNIINVKPGDAGYNDFWQVHMVTVPANYVANTITSYQAIVAGGYTIQPTNNLVNCPVVPLGSTATKRLNSGDNSLTKGWYKDSVIHYFNFVEKALTGNMVPTSPIYVTFNINPGQPGGGPPSGFVVETGTMQTHNVISTLPADAGYSPLWDVNIYDNSSFSSVKDLATALTASVLVPGAADVNCPVVSITAPAGIQINDLFSVNNVYPNPVENSFILNVSAEVPMQAKISIINVLGETLVSSTEFINSSFRKSYDVSSLAPGIYVININSNNQVASQRIIKK